MKISLGPTDNIADGPPPASTAWLCSALNERDLERLAGPILLKAVSNREGVIHIVMLENIEAAIQGNLPSVVGDDVARMDRSGPIELPSKVNPDGDGGVLC